jgi:uncharacterized protein with FMN-binding domain
MGDLMKRAAPGMALAGLALTTVWVFDPALHTDPAPTAAAGIEEDSAPLAEEPTDVGDDAGSDAGSESGADDNTETADDSTTTEESTPAATDCSDPTMVTGDEAMTQWGPVQVQMGFAADGSVCSVQAIAYPVNDQRSARINASAIPYLDAQATEVGVAFDAVSGATYTSEAYRDSMQSILDQR